MRSRIRKLLSPILPAIDIGLSPITLLSAIWLKLIRRIRIEHMPFSKRLFKSIGVFPIIDHYYEPLFHDNKLTRSLSEDRVLPGIEMNEIGQLELLNQFNFQEELQNIPIKNITGNSLPHFFFDNPSLGPGDAEFLYCMIRLYKPARIIEVGSGYSTLLSLEAIRKNKECDPSHECLLTCIEPYEMPWLEKTTAKIIRRKVEDVDPVLFQTLTKNDILFIDSSHMIRPQGDVLAEILQVLPVLQKGVLVHIHDIFTPKDYSRSHLVDRVLFWNEQYLLEAFLTCNTEFRIIGALNFLKHHYPAQVRFCFPVLDKYWEQEPGSFWMVSGSQDGTAIAS